jgi:hypothetical protein
MKLSLNKELFVSFLLMIVLLIEEIITCRTDYF